MKRVPIVLLVVLLATLVACSRTSGPGPGPAAAEEPLDPSSPETIVKTDEQWRRELTEEQYRVTRQRGTERPFTGEYNGTKTAGTYECVCCGQALFRSDVKYESGCGWPAFWEPEGGRVSERMDHSLGMVRVEVVCSRCDAHLGHVFDDGPEPTGKRYCINSASLRLRPDEAKDD